MHITSRGQELHEKAKRLIPGGTQLLSKRPELFAPDMWPPYYSKAKGCTIEDIDGKSYIDMTTMGIGTCLLGYADPQVNQAVIDTVNAGNMSSLNPPEEVELAELLVTLHPWAEMVRYARSGGEAMAIAVRIARAASGRDDVAFCGYHGWHDWYLAANLADNDNLGEQLLPGLAPAGVPSGLSGTIHPFHYNQIDELEAIVARQSRNLAAIVMEPIRYQPPEEGFLEKVREIATRVGAVLVFDEITSGWRHTVGGAHLFLNVEPDMAVFAKAMSNGFPMSAVIGKESVMDAAQRSFISSTYWTERTGPAAALSTIHEFQRRDVPRILADRGTSVQQLWNRVAEESKLQITIEGLPALSHFTFDHPEENAIATLLTQNLLQRDVLGNTAYYASAGHTEEVISTYAEALSFAFRELRRAIEDGPVLEHLSGPVRHTGFARLT